MILCSVLLLTACGGDDDKGSTSGRLEITLEDEQRHRLLNTVSYDYYTKDPSGNLDPGAAGKGVVWDFSYVNLDEYESKLKRVTETRKEDYATSKFKNYFPEAVECYVVRQKITYHATGKLSDYSDVYFYLNGNIDYGGVQDATISGLTSISIWYNTPVLSPPYPQYFGMKYTEKTTMSLEDSDYSFLYHIDVEIDGEGTLILPNGEKFTDVLRYKMNNQYDSGSHISYGYASKKFGELASISLGSPTSSFSFTDEWK